MNPTTYDNVRIMSKIVCSWKDGSTCTTCEFYGVTELDAFNRCLEFKYKPVKWWQLWRRDEQLKISTYY